jgi:excinuclease ABC subunit B
MITRPWEAVCICRNSVRWASADTANGITPQSIIRPLEMGLAGILNADYADLTDEAEGMPDFATQQELDDYIGKLESDMREAAKKFEFEKASKLRDTVKELRTKKFLFS